MFINLSNHPSDEWKEKQRQAAIISYNEITDMAFPDISPKATTQDIHELANTYFQRIKILKNQAKGQPFVVHVMGEMTFVFRIVTLLKAAHIKCMASTTERDTIQNMDGSKIFKFEFVQFREYV